MQTPWFDPSLAWIPGTALGILAGIYGSLIGILLPLSNAKRRMVGLGFLRACYFGMAAAAVCLALLGVFAFFSGQPQPIWYGLGFAGFIGFILVASSAGILFRLPPKMQALWKKAELLEQSRPKQ